MVYSNNTEEKYMKCTNEKSLITRLNKIEGQIRGIKKLIEEDDECEKILIQISAAKSALHKTGQQLLEAHIEHCVLNDIRNGNEEEVLRKLSTVIEQFSRLD